MSRHLALVAGDPPSALKPGYSWSLAHDKCQKCGQAGAGVRTAGMKSPQGVSFTWLALCPDCIELGLESGWPMVAGVAAPDPLAAIREVFAGPAGEVPEDMDWQKLGEGLPEPPSPRLPVAVAKYPGICPACGQAVNEGDPIALAGGRWRHARCAS